MPKTPLETNQLTISSADAKRRIADNWETVRGAVDAVAKDHGHAVKLIGVSKYVSPEITSWLVEAGCHDLGENRPQFLNEKATWLSVNSIPKESSVRWHQIGHLQRNKVRKLLSVAPLIHALDSIRLLDAIHEEAVTQGLVIEALIEVNLSGEDAKTGLPIASLPVMVDHYQSLLETASQKSGIRLVGFMGMAGWGTDPDEARHQFASLRILRDETQASSGLQLPELSMGMSGDYEAAIAEGATMVRIGSKLFQGVL